MTDKPSLAPCRTESFDQQALDDARIAYRDAFSNGADVGAIIRATIRKYLDTLGLDAQGTPYTRAPSVQGDVVEQLLAEFEHGFRLGWLAKAADTGWRDISTHCVNKIEHVLIAVRHSQTGEWLVGEAYLNDNREWWWANEDHGDYYAEPLNITHGIPEFWQPLPPPPVNPQMGEG